MFDKLKAFFVANEPSAEEAIIIIRKMLKFLTPAEMAELKMIIASLDKVAVVINDVDKVADTVIQ